MTPGQFIAFLQETLALCARHTVDGGINYVCMDWRHMRELLQAGAAASCDVSATGDAMPSALLTADSAKLSIVAINPDKLRVSYRDGTVDRSTMIIHAALPSPHAVVLSNRAGE